MKKFLLMATLMLTSMISPSFATLVQFDTLSSQLCVGAIGCGVQTQTFGNLNITFNPFTSGNLDPNQFGFANTSFGTITIDCANASCATSSIPANLNLYLRFNQTLPQAGSGEIVSSTITGTFSFGGGGGQITWTVPSTNIIAGTTNIKYSVVNTPLSLNAPSQGGTSPTNATGVIPGVTSIQGRVEDASVPEPSTYALIGGALLGLGYLRRKK